MQFGVFSVSDIRRDLATGITPTDAERIDAIQQIALKTEEVGLDVFAIGEHHTVDYFSSSPATLLAAIAAQTRTLTLSTAVTSITTNDPVRLAEEYSTLQHISKGRFDLVLGMSDAIPLRPASGPGHKVGLDLAIENYYLLYRLWHEEIVDWEGGFRTPLMDFTATPRPLDDQPPLVWHSTSRSMEIADQAASYGDGFFASNVLAPVRQYADLVACYREGFEKYGHGTAEEAIVGLGGQVFVAKDSQEAERKFRPYFDAARVRGMSLEEAMAQTSLAVGSPQQVIEKVLSFREVYGDYQRQLFWIDQAGLGLGAVLEQLEILGAEIVPALRAEFEFARPASTPSDPPTHADLVRDNYVELGARWAGDAW